MVYTVRFGAGYFFAGVHTFFTAAPGFTWILRDMVVSIGDPAGTYMVVTIQESPDSPLYLIRDISPRASSVIHLDIRQEILVGESLVLTTDAATATVAATGYRFVGEQDRPTQLPAAA